VPFGKGNIRRRRGPESANNAGAQTSFIPLLTLGIPPNAVMALMVGAMTIHNIQPGPQVMTSNPELFWGLIASMWIGNADAGHPEPAADRHVDQAADGALPLAVPGHRAVLRIGVYSTNNNVFDVWMVAIFGVFGYLFIKLGCEPAPLLLGFILGPMMEENLRRALLLSRGDWSVFVTRPLSAGLLVAAALLLVHRAAAVDQGQARRGLRRVSPAPALPEQAPARRLFHFSNAAAMGAPHIDALVGARHTSLVVRPERRQTARHQDQAACRSIESAKFCRRRAAPPTRIPRHEIAPLQDCC
jgi:TctA family transporter